MAVAPPTAWWCGCNRPPSAVMALTLAQAEGGRTWSWLLAVVVGHGCWAWLMVSGQPQSTPDRAGDMVVTVDNKERSRAPARSLKTIVDFAVGSHAQAVAVLLAVALLGFLPGFFSLPPIHRDQAPFPPPPNPTGLRSSSLPPPFPS